MLYVLSLTHSLEYGWHSYVLYSYGPRAFSTSYTYTNNAILQNKLFSYTVVELACTNTHRVFFNPMESTERGLT